MDMPYVASPPLTPETVTESWAYTQLKVVVNSFKWTIDNFSNSFEETGESIFSPTFPADGSNDEHKWRIKLYPRGTCEEYKHSLSLFLELVSSNTTEVRAKYKFFVLDASKQETNIIFDKCAKLFVPKSKGWGYERFIDSDFLLNRAGALLPLDKLTLCCEVRVFADPITLSGRNIQAIERPLPHEFGKLLESQKLSDVCLISADGHELRAHKAILAARSPVFSDMFEFEMKESILGRVTLTDMDLEVLQGLVQFIYTGKVSNLGKRPEDLLVAADKYALDHLKVICEDHLCKTLSVSNAAEILMLADVRSANLLKSGVINFINMHATEVMDTDSWQEMCKTHPRLVSEVFSDLARQLKPLNNPPQKRQKL